MNVDRAKVAELLLSDEALSGREIARRCSCSEFSVRTVKRDLERSGHLSRHAPHYDDDPTAAVSSWLVFAVLVVGIAGVLWLVARQAPLGGDSMP